MAVLARMTNYLGAPNNAAHVYEGYSVDKHSVAAYPKLTIALCVDAAAPHPAIVWTTDHNLGPKVKQQIFGV